MFEKGMEFALNKIKKNITDFSDCFPSAESRDYVYEKNTELKDWTEGFWTGMLWLAYELTGENPLKETAQKLGGMLRERVYGKHYTDTHDLGFLYTLSSVAEYKLTGDEEAKKTAIEAAEQLIIRFHEKGQFIQAWGPLNDAGNYRLIIDCLMNLPLLFWASEVTGDGKYADIAKRHFYTAIDCVIRDDYTTHHTFYFDPVTGEKTKGVTAQGYSDNSCWARGQAWGVYGIALAYGRLKDEGLPSLFNKVTDVFLSKLPADSVPYWDMVFTDGDEPRDTSAAVIAVCGILEMNKYFKNDKYTEAAKKMMQSLEDNYLTDEKSNGILTDAMYSKPNGSKPECNIWGDYYYLEAIMRFNNPEWKIYW